MTEIKAMAYVNGGVLKHVLPEKLKAEIKQLKDGEYNIIIKRHGRRSSPQNRYLWGVVIAMITAHLKSYGNDVDEETVHEILKLKFNPHHIKDTEGTVIETVGGSTAEMSKWEMMEYLDKIIAWALNNLGLNIPPPTSYDLADMETEPKKELTEVRGQYGIEYQPKD